MKQIAIGRNTTSDIVVDSSYNTVSTNHATIIEDNGRIIFKDHSSNGSYVNGHLVHQTQVEIQMHDAIFLSRSYQLDMNQVRRCLGLGRETQRNSQQNAHTMQDFGQQHVVTPQPQAQYQQPVHQQQATPKCLNKFSWGAFLLSWIWGVCHRVWISLLCFIPYVNFVMIFVLGFNGNKWAWEKCKDTMTADEFDARQKSWTKGALIYTIVVVIFSVIVGIVSVS